MNSVVNILSTVPSSYFYYKLNKEMETTQTKKIAMNSTALFHASSSVFMGLNYLWSNSYSSLIRANTGGYVLFDLYYIIKDGKYDLLRLMYIYHHLAVYSYMLLPKTLYHWPYVVFYAELSNIPNYLVYYNLKQDASKKLWKGYKSKTTKNLMKLQMYTYGFFRILVLGYFTYLELKGNHRKPIPIYMTSMLYIFGLIWFGVMAKQNMK